MSYQSGTTINGTVATATVSGSSIADLTTWDSRPDGTSDGERGVASTGAIYRWHAASSLWVANEAYEAGTLAHVATIDGDENQAAIEALGYTVTKSGSGVITNTTISGREYVTLDSDASNGDTCYLKVSTVSGYGRYYAGYVRVDATGTSSYAGGVIFFEDGARKYYSSLVKDLNDVVWVSGTNTAGSFLDGGADVRTAAVWFEMLVSPGGGGYIRTGNSENWHSCVGPTQLSATSLIQDRIGDLSGSFSSEMHLAEFTTWAIS